MAKKKKSLDAPPPISTDAAYAPLLALMRDRFVSSAELAKRWHYSENHMSNMRRRGKLLPYIRLPGGRILYRLSDVILAELGGVNGPITLDQTLIFLSALHWLDPVTRKHLADEFRKAFG